MFGDNLDPVEVTELLRIPPDEAHRKGETRKTISKKGKALESVPYQFGMWSINSKEDEYATLEQHISSLLRLMYPMKDNLLSFLDKGYTMDMFCGVFIRDTHQPGFDLNSDILLKLGEINIKLGMCFYQNLSV